MTKSQEALSAQDGVKVLDAIEKTGFPLEHRTATAFAKRGWSVVANKYYVDDNSGEVREIDLIAYKATRLDSLTVYSAVIVSCKKTSENAWVFLSRPLNPNDPNRDLAPLHYWTNDKALSFSMAQNDFAAKYTKRMSRPSPMTWGAPESEVFAFQELSPSRSSTGEISGYKPWNDKAIFSSVTSLMKAQAYELGRLPERAKNNTVVYIFSLLSVMDGELLEAGYQDLQAKVARKDSFKYIAHYIINRKEQFCRINFVHPSLLDKAIKECDDGHVTSVEFVEKTINNFYETSLDNQKQIDVFEDSVINRLQVWVNIFGKLNGAERMSTKNTVITYKKESNTIIFGVSSEAPESKISMLNQDTRVVSKAKEIIRSTYRKDVNVYFEWDVPF